MTVDYSTTRRVTRLLFATRWPGEMEPLLVLTGSASPVCTAPSIWQRQVFAGFGCVTFDHLEIPWSGVVAVRCGPASLSIDVAGRRWAACPMPTDPVWQRVRRCLFGVATGLSATDAVGERFVEMLYAGQAVIAEVPIALWPSRPVRADRCGRLR